MEQTERDDMSSNVRLQNIAVVGGAGYIGANTVHALASAGYRPIVLDNLSKGYRSFVPGVELVEVDITSKEALCDFFDRTSVDAVIHFAALTEVGGSMRDPAEYYRVNVAGTILLVQAMLNASVDKLVFSSSAAVYGTPAAVPITEEHPLAPINPYGRTKMMMEQIMADCQKAAGLAWVALRYFNAAGAETTLPCGEWHVPETHLVPNILRSAAGKNRVLELYGTDHPTHDGTAVRDYIHVTDLANAHVAALRYLEKGSSGVFNLGIGKGFSVKEVIQAAEEVVGQTIPFVEKPIRLGDPPSLVADSSKAQKELGWKPQRTDIHAIVKSAWDWYEQYGFDPPEKFQV